MSLESMSNLDMWRWPTGEPCCPYCGEKNPYRIKTRQKFKCRDCLRQFSATSGTRFHSAKLGADKIALLIAVSNSIPSARALKDALGVQYRTAWRRLHQAQAIEARSGETAGLVLEDESAVAESHASDATPPSTPETSA